MENARHNLEEDIQYCNYCKCNTKQVAETTGMRCQKCGNQNPYFNSSSDEYADYLYDLVKRNNLRSFEDLEKYYQDKKDGLEKLFNRLEGVQASVASKAESSDTADKQKIISSCGQVSEQEQETNEQRVQRLMKGQRGRSQDREGLTGEQEVYVPVDYPTAYILEEPGRPKRWLHPMTIPQPNKQTLTDEGSRYDELEKQVVELLGVTGQPNVLSVIEYVKMLQSK